MHNRKAILLLNCTVLAAALLFFAWINSAAVNSRKLPPKDDRAIIHRVSRQVDAYPVYQTAGLWGARVVHLNRYFNMQTFSPKDRFVTTEFPVQVPGMREVYEAGLDSHNWLFIATRTGLVRTVTTVLPDPVFDEIARSADRSSTFRMSGNVLKGLTYDVQRVITKIGSLPLIAEPVVVNVDAAYFNGGADPARTAVLLKAQCRDVRMLVLIDSVDKPEVTEEMRERLRQFEMAWRTAR